MAVTTYDPNPGSMLKKPVFNIPVTLIDRDGEGKEVLKSILVSYQFDDDIEDEIQAGVVDEKATQEAQEKAKALVGDGELPLMEPIMRSFTTSEQLAKIVRGIKGIEEELNTQYWRGVPSKHKQAIIAAINADINPPKQPSAA